MSTTLDETLQSLQALNDLARLEQQHNHFIRTLSGAPNSKIGTMNFTNTSITCNCLHHSITIKHRPVAISKRICAMEYDFSLVWKEKELSIFHLYLQRDGYLSKDVNGKDPFSDCMAITQEKILTTVCLSLLDSPVFSPLN